MPNVVEDVPAASPADPERGIQGSPDLGPAAGAAAGDGLQVTLGKNMPKVFVLLVASFVVMLQASIEHGRNGPGRNGVVVLMDVNLPWFSYAVALGTVSLGFTLALLFIAKFRAPVYTSFNVKLPLFGQASLLQLYSGFMIVWWGIGAGLLTFHKPYTYTGNAYFACWAALIASMLLFVSSFVRAKTAWRTMSGAVQNSSSSKARFVMPHPSPLSTPLHPSPPLSAPLYPSQPLAAGLVHPAPRLSRPLFRIARLRRGLVAGRVGLVVRLHLGPNGHALLLPPKTGQVEPDHI